VSRPETEGQVVPFDRRLEDYPEVNASLFDETEADDLRKQWERVQTNFVDEPRKAVEEADGLVTRTIERIADGFSRQRGELEGQWKRGQQISTEDLRVAMQRYRSFFSRLLSI
jgi:hypothetical protein